MTVQIAASIPEEIAARLTALAQSTGRSKDDLVAEALQMFMVSTDDLEALVDEARQSVEAEGLVDHEDVVAEFKRKYASLK